MLGKVFKAYDVRATYPTPLNETTAWKIGFGTARFLIEQAEAAGKTDPMMRHIVVGRDMRPSSPALADALIDGIRSYGAHVIELGMVDTPFIYFAINYLDCAGGVQTTASHNPIEYNGFKISAAGALPVGQNTGLEEISKYAAMADPDKIKQTHPESGPPGRTEARDLWSGYADHVQAFLDEFGSRSLKVVVDASNGMAGTMIPRIFANVQDLEIVEIYFKNDTGTFEHEPNPLVATNLSVLRERVLSEKADFGVCFDGDADRGIFVDEKAQIIGCDHLTGVLAEHFLREDPGSAVVYDLRSSKAVEEAVLAARGRPIRSRVGHVFMKEVLRREEGVFGGELSGHFYFRDNFNTDSGAIVFATLCTLLSNTSDPLSAIIAPMARYVQSGEINFQTDAKDEAITELADTYGEFGDVDDLDGVTVDCFESQGWWCNVRKSNTEPLLRLNLEARNQEICDRMVAEISPMLGHRVEH